jgi:hypothetical protein
MATLSGRSQIFAGDTSLIDTTAQHKLGTRAFDVDGNEYIYLAGVASVAAGTWVSFDEALATTRLTTNCVGRVAIAMAAIVASSYGWFQIYGKNEIAVVADIEADVALFTTGTAGTADDADTANEMIIGAFSRSVDAAGIATVELNYPFVCNVAID